MPLEHSPLIPGATDTTSIDGLCCVVLERVHIIITKLFKTFSRTSTNRCVTVLEWIAISPLLIALSEVGERALIDDVLERSCVIVRLRLGLLKFSVLLLFNLHNVGLNMQVIFTCDWMKASYRSKYEFWTRCISQLQSVCGWKSFLVLFS